MQVHMDGAAAPPRQTPTLGYQAPTPRVSSASWQRDTVTKEGATLLPVLEHDVPGDLVLGALLGLAVAVLPRLLGRRRPLGRRRLLGRQGGCGGDKEEWLRLLHRLLWQLLVGALVGNALLLLGLVAATTGALVVSAALLLAIATPILALLLVCLLVKLLALRQAERQGAW